MLKPSPHWIDPHKAATFDLRGSTYYSVPVAVTIEREGEPTTNVLPVTPAKVDLFYTTKSDAAAFAAGGKIGDVMLQLSHDEVSRVLGRKIKFDADGQLVLSKADNSALGAFTACMDAVRKAPNIDRNVLRESITKMRNEIGTGKNAASIEIIDSMKPLIDLVSAQVRAVCISLEAEVAVTEVVRADHKLNHAREKRGKLPILDYHVVTLAHRRRTLPRAADLDPNREYTRKRLHLRRGHWRHYDGDFRTWIKWCLVGDPELGFVDKEYRL